VIEIDDIHNIDADSVRSLAKNIYGTEISENLLELLLQKCLGNPFYTEQMVLYLKESGSTVTKNKKPLRELHLITAGTIESLYSDEPEKHYSDLAYHFEKAELKPESKKYLYFAGNYSSENYRNEEAINYYTKLYDYCDSEPEQAKVLRFIGEIYIRLGDWKNTESIFKKKLQKSP